MLSKEIILNSIQIDNKFDFLKSINHLSDSDRVYMRWIWFINKSNESKYSKIWEKIKIAIDENFIDEAQMLTEHCWKSRSYDFEHIWSNVAKKVEDRRRAEVAKSAEAAVIKDDSVPF